MKGDFSRFSFDKRKNYSGLLKQQGRVSIDADWNEQIAITAHQVQARTEDTIGVCGVHLHDGGFEIRHPGKDFGKNLLISTGRIYVNGLLCELRPSSKVPILGFPTNRKVKVGELKIDGVNLETDQWILLCSEETSHGLVAKIEEIDENEATLRLNENISALKSQTAPCLRRMILYSSKQVTEGQTDLVYLDVWERHITSIEDPDIREIALGGLDTATRIQTIAQVKILSAVGNLCCSEAIQKLNQEYQSGGRLKTQMKAGTESEDPCLISEGGGYRELENRLYRVEIHEGGDIGVATFKWSRDNGSVVFAIEDFIGDLRTNRIKVKSLGKDQVLTLHVGDWVEISDDISELNGEPGTLAQIVDPIDEAQGIITLSKEISGYSVEAHSKVRRWDQNTETEGILVKDELIDLEDGVQIRFSGSNFKTGDYWVFVARTLTGEVEKLDFELPMGIKHHYCPLALVKWEKKDKKWEPVLKDCRPVFPPITELTNLFYISGDEPEAMPGEKLSKPLRVGVANGQWPVANASVQFKIIDDNGEGKLEVGNKGILQTGNNDERKIIIVTNSEGLAECIWQLGMSSDNEFYSQQVEATLLDDTDKPIHLPVYFNANKSEADHVYYDPQDCKSLQDVTTVQKAIDRITQLMSFFYISGDGQEVLPDPEQTKKLLPLPDRLQVGVANMCGPVAGAIVRFEIVSGNGQLKSSEGAGRAIDIPTAKEDGIASCDWEIDSQTPRQQVKATLQNAPDNLIHMPILFNASLSVASHIAYDPKDSLELKDSKTVQDAIDVIGNFVDAGYMDYTPPGNCTNLQGVTTVKAAIDRLIQFKSLYYVSGDRQEVLSDPSKEFIRLPLPFQVGVSNMCGPVLGATVVFVIIIGNGRLKGTKMPPSIPVKVKTDSDGIASCFCEIDNKKPTLQVKVNLIVEYENPIHFPISFTANCKLALEFQIYMGKDNQFYFRLYIGGEIILRSEGYESKSGCQNGISAVKKYAPKAGRYQRKTAADGQFYFVLTAPSKEVVGMSKMYATEVVRDKGIALVKTLAPDASIEDKV